MDNSARHEKKVREFAHQHKLTTEQARMLLDDHGDDEGRLAEAVRTLVHFIRAPS